MTATERHKQLVVEAQRLVDGIYEKWVRDMWSNRQAARCVRAYWNARARLERRQSMPTGTGS